MGAYRPMFLPEAGLKSPRWLCGCGHEEPYREDGPAYPICPRDGQRMRFLNADGLLYVTRSEEGAGC